MANLDNVQAAPLVDPMELDFAIFQCIPKQGFSPNFCKEKIVNLNFICNRVFLSINIGVIVISIISFKAIIFDGVEVKLFQFNGQLNSLTCKVEFMQGQGRCE